MQCPVELFGNGVSSADRHAGFERMVAEVCLGNVGAVYAREVARFAGNSRGAVGAVVAEAASNLQPISYRAAALDGHQDLCVYRKS